MDKKEKFKRVLIMIFVASGIFTCFYSYKTIQASIPDEISCFYGEQVTLQSNYPVRFEKEKYVETSLKVNKNLVSEYKVSAKLLGIISLKDIRVNVISKQEVIPCGFQIGIYLHTNGVMVIDTEAVKDINGNSIYPAKNLVLKDDYIVSLNGIKVSSKSQLLFLINKYGKDEIELGIRRNQTLINVKLKPVSIGENQYKTGIWVRDDSQGIGTLTYVTEDGVFAGLGHGIGDVDTGNLLSSENGVLYHANIWGIKKGKAGNPGGLLGSIRYEKENELGMITGNTNYGIFGIANEKLLSELPKQKLPIALKKEISTGKATLRCMMDGKSEDFEVEIEDVNQSGNCKDKGMVVKITDTRLLDMTGGIVQGMSGSPIIQNGKLIGALTHVFVDDPTRGYGIFIETMISEE